MATDPYRQFSSTPQTFGRAGAVVTPSASDLTKVAKGLVVLAAGDATVVPVDNADGTTLSFVGLSAGAIIPYQVRRVTAATATLATIDG